MSELFLRQPGFTYEAWGPFTEQSERIKKFKEIGDLNHIYKNELDKACFAHDVTYYVSLMLSPNMLGLNLWKIKNLKQFFMVLLMYLHLNVNQIN